MPEVPVTLVAEEFPNVGRAGAGTQEMGGEGAADGVRSKDESNLRSPAPDCDFDTVGLKPPATSGGKKQGRFVVGSLG